MKHLLLTLAFAFTSLTLAAQSFEGKIVYQNTYKSKSPELSDEQLNLMMGTEQSWYLKGGDYKSETNGMLMLWQLYLGRDNRLYSKFANTDMVVWNDGAANADEVIKTELRKGAVEILGYTCDELVLTCKSGVQKYYFSSQLAVDTKLFQNHLYGNWFAYLTKANAVPLKIVIESPQFALESVATLVQPMKLSAKLFALPANVPTMKSPY
ncbi:DUF4412 domain-containing protein [Pontibacter sp. E15-1]|uniref:DUF4412 domain-containing protein n=1 Tax=Pontibacter sp. E15-1 TaxID=2919918 RepID=UPI001F4F6CFB|nr:DUF4412 domain-containing protein [Pontibacter sp. E15-1]MCJ8166054.1 DUF4412 domain-containing protein [Pontibacter sp. E15-1]